VIPDIMFLRISENDIMPNTDSVRLANDILSAASYLIKGVDINCVVVG